MRRPLVLVCALSAGSSASAAQSGAFTDITEEARLDFLHDPGDSGRYLLPEIMGSGAAFFDYDADGDLDIYLVQAGRPAHGTATVESTEANRLFRQSADGTFEDVTELAGLGDRGYGMGVAVGDVDNDGHLDVYVTNYGRDALYRNRGAGRFEDVTLEAGIAGDHWSASAVFCDYDRDGYLDLFVTHYVSYDPEEHCTQADGSADYCAPSVFPGTPDALYHNRGNGTFEDVSRASGIDRARARGLGVVCADLDADGWLDFYVANDGDANHLWQNQRDGSFADESFLAGVALNAMGRPEAGMGVVAGDVDADGDLDLFLTHIADETNTLYLNDGAVGFDDRSTAFGLAAPSLGTTGFGAGFLDIDLDGHIDLAIVNGRVERRRSAAGVASEGWSAYAETNELMRNAGGTRFERVSQPGDFTRPVEVSRGLALGDVDRDGDIDLLVTNTAGRARLYRNDAVTSGEWILVRAYDPVHRRDAHGARITAVTKRSRYLRLANPGYGYLSSHDPRAHFGLPRGALVEHFELVWPDGTAERFPGAASNQEIVLEKGRGR